LLYSPFQKLKNLQFGTNVAWHDAYCQQPNEISKIKSIFNHQMLYPNIEEMDDSINSNQNHYIQLTFGLMIYIMK
jgi:hypothetical protein